LLVHSSSKGSLTVRIECAERLEDYSIDSHFRLTDRLRSSSSSSGVAQTFLQHKKPEIVMNQKVMSLLLVGVMACAVQAFAEDASHATSHRDAMNSSEMTPQQKQMMKHCMAQQKKANKDKSMSMDDMKKACQDQVKIQMQKDGPMPAAPPTSTAKP